MTPNWLGRESPYLSMKAPYSYVVIFHDDGDLKSKEYSGTSREVVEWRVTCNDKDKVISTGAYQFSDALAKARMGKTLFNRCFRISQGSSRSKVDIREIADSQDPGQTKIVPMPPHPSSVPQVVQEMMSPARNHKEERNERDAREAAEPEAVREAMRSAEDGHYFRPETGVPTSLVDTPPTQAVKAEARLSREVATMREQKASAKDHCSIVIGCQWRGGTGVCSAKFFCPKKITPGMMGGE